MSQPSFPRLIAGVFSHSEVDRLRRPTGMMLVFSKLHQVGALASLGFQVNNLPGGNYFKPPEEGKGGAMDAKTEYCWILIVAIICSIFLTFIAFSNAADDQEVLYGTGSWDSDILGNHRAVIWVSEKADAVRAHLLWRRRDFKPESKNIIVVDAATGARITNLFRAEVNREFGDIVFQPVTVPGDYYVYYMPHVMSGRRNYPTVTYQGPEDTADSAWLRRHRLETGALDQEKLSSFPLADLVEIQAIDELNSFYPMEVIACRDEVEKLLSEHQGDSYLLFPEDRAYPIRMTDDIPYKWIEDGPRNAFTGEAARGEFYAFQVGLFASRAAAEDVQARFSGLTSAGGKSVIPAEAFSAFNLGGTDWTGKKFKKECRVEKGKVQALWFGVQVPPDAVPGEYIGVLTVAPRGQGEKAIEIGLTVTEDILKDAGDGEPWRHSRLRWLDSMLAFDDGLVPPYTPMKVEGDFVACLGRRLTIGQDGLPAGIQSHFAPEMTHLVETGKEVLAAPIKLIVERADGENVEWTYSGPTITKQAEGAVAWRADGRSGSLTMSCRAQMEFDGFAEFLVTLKSSEPLDVDDIRLEVPIRKDVAVYSMGMGIKGGYRPKEFHWKWDKEFNHDSAWVGDVNAGLQCAFRDENYSRPLNTNFYHLKPLNMPPSWFNGGKGGCDFSERGDDTFLISSYSGPRRIQAGEELHFNFTLLITPFKPLDTDAQWTQRYYHRYEPLDTIAAAGANVINVHHATEINPYINYPFLRPEEMKAYIDEAHAKGLKVKIYYTVRELSNRAPEIFALRSLGDEVLAYGPGGGFAWLQEHLGSDYIAAWFVPDLEDAAVINSGVSRWHNYYVEGLNWLVGNVGIDGLYIDDVAFDRTTMKRVRKVLDRNRPGALIDLHSANQFNERDGFANSANLYLEHFPYLNRLWFGEYFDYGSPPDFWLIEVSGIPFGLMGEMLQDGGNPWRGLVFGMTSRLPWAGDPRPIWQVWDDFGIQGSRMVGYWAPSCPVKTGRSDIPATVYIKEGKTLIALASWADEPVDCRLSFDWTALGIDPTEAVLSAPAVEGFQEAAEFGTNDVIPVQPGKGYLLILREKVS
jgi:hypothetical protein